MKFLAFGGRMGGRQPEWYRHLVAAATLGVPPWYLPPAHPRMGRLMVWREWALAKEQAELRAESLRSQPVER